MQRFPYGRPASRASSIGSVGEGQDEAGWLARMVDGEEGDGEDEEEVGVLNGELSVPAAEVLDVGREGGKGRA